MSISITAAVNENTDISETDGCCGICLINKSKYTCPRCHLLYCSVACFKHQKHAGCSESFYKDCFVEELKQRRATKEEKRNILEMLKTFEEENPEDLDVQSLEDRLQDVDLNAIREEELWNKLSNEEQTEFNDILRRNAGSLIPVWTPWWLNHNQILVTEIGEKDHTLIPANIPAATLKVPELSTMLQNKKPSPLVCHNLVNILYPYAIFCRFYNGNIDDFAEEFCYHVLKCSTFLQKGIPLSTLEEAFCVAKEWCVSQGVANQETLSESVLDVYHILLGRDEVNQKTYVKAALSQLYTETKSSKKKLSEHFHDLEQRDLFHCLKRLEFLIAWVEEDKENLTLLAIKIMAFYKQQKIELEMQSRVDEDSKLLRKKAHKKNLIEEIEH